MEHPLDGQSIKISANDYSVCNAHPRMTNQMQKVGRIDKPLSSNYPVDYLILKGFIVTLIYEPAALITRCDIERHLSDKDHELFIWEWTV